LTMLSVVVPGVLRSTAEADMGMEMEMDAKKRRDGKLRCGPSRTVGSMGCSLREERGTRLITVRDWGGSFAILGIPIATLRLWSGAGCEVGISLL
jgi:hypothetical protein